MEILQFVNINNQRDIYYAIIGIIAVNIFYSAAGLRPVCDDCISRSYIFAASHHLSLYYGKKKYQRVPPERNH